MNLRVIIWAVEDLEIFVPPILGELALSELEIIGNQQHKFNSLEYQAKEIKAQLIHGWTQDLTHDSQL